MPAAGEGGEEDELVGGDAVPGEPCLRPAMEGRYAARRAIAMSCPVVIGRSFAVW
jgi:hypothetical protein